MCFLKNSATVCVEQDLEIALNVSLAFLFSISDQHTCYNLVEFGEWGFYKT